MRYHFVDEIVSLALDGAPRIEVAKRFAAGDDVFSGPHDVDRVPESMLLELMAMTGGHLVFRHLGERRLPLLLKVPECRFDGFAAVGRLDRLAALGLPASRGAEVATESVQRELARLPRKQQKLYNRATLLAMLGAALAMEDAGLAPGAGDPGRFGVLLGVNTLAWDLAAMLTYLVASESRQAPGTLDMAVANGFCMHHINPLDFSLKTLPNLAAGHVAIAHDAQGFCRAMTDGPIGGARAVGDAYRLVAEGDLDVALCGGADAQLEELFFATYWGA